MKYIVYLTINTINRFIYVGVHKTDPSKFDGYIGCGVWRHPENPKTPFQRAVAKYKYDSFERITLGVFDTLEAAYTQEASIVTREFVSRPDVYNSALGGSGGGSKGKKIIQYSLDGKFIRTWDSLVEAYEFFNKKSHSRLVKCLTGKDPHYLGFQWKYWEEDFPRIINPVTSLELPLHQYTLDGVLVKTWKNKLKAAKALECSSSSLRHSTQSMKPYIGFQWRYFKGDAPDSIPRYINKDIVLQLDKNGKIVKEWSKLIDALNEGFRVSRDMKPRTGKAKDFDWVYKHHYILETDHDIVRA